VERRGRVAPEEKKRVDNWQEDANPHTRTEMSAHRLKKERVAIERAEKRVYRGTGGAIREGGGGKGIYGTTFHQISNSGARPEQRTQLGKRRFSRGDLRYDA